MQSSIFYVEHAKKPLPIREGIGLLVSTVVVLITLEGIGKNHTGREDTD